MNEAYAEGASMLTDDIRVREALAALDAGETDAARELAAGIKAGEDRLLLTARISEAAGDAEGAKRNYYDAVRTYNSSRARQALNALCSNLIAEYSTGEVKTGEMRDYDGNAVAFDRGDIPVCARLIYDGRLSVMDIRLNVVQRNMADMSLSKPARAVIQGIKQWQGSYSVFGGYPLEIRISCTYELRRSKSLIINVLDDETTDSVGSILNKLGKRGRRGAEILNARRQSAAVIGNTWRPSGVKYINIYEKDLMSVPRCKFLLRHEFGHVLGLDDMYAEAADGRAGVKEVYPDIEMLRIRGCIFNMVMCSVDAPVTFKEAEMALLAYRDGVIQRFQLRDGKGEISRALRQ